MDTIILTFLALPSSYLFSSYTILDKGSEACDTWRLAPFDAIDAVLAAFLPRDLDIRLGAGCRPAYSSSSTAGPENKARDPTPFSYLSLNSLPLSFSFSLSP